MRGGTSSGAFEDDNFQAHSHSFTTTLYGFDSSAAGLDLAKTSNAGGRYSHPGIDGTTPLGSGDTPRTTSETRPVNMTVVWIMKIREDNVDEDERGFAVIEHRVPGGGGGGSVANTWNLRTLNTIQTNLNGISLTNNRITMAAGTYRVQMTAHSHRTGRSKLRLQNVTDDVTAVFGHSTFAPHGESSMLAYGQGVIVLNATKEFELQHYTEETHASAGLGVGTNDGSQEIFAQVYIAKLQPPLTFREGDFTGSVNAFATDVAPQGWLECDGRALDRTAYSRLFARIGERFGTGDGSSTFNIPDLRGEFVRGWDHGRGVDGGRAFASVQLDQFQGHYHAARFQNSTAPFQQGIGYGGADWTFGPNAAIPTGGAVNDGSNGTPRTGSETRPRNVAMMYCIKC